MSEIVAQWTADGAIAAVIDGEQWVVPDDMGNRHRQMIAEWEAQGNTIAPYEPPPSPLAPLTRRQLRLGLLANGITTADVEAAIAAIPDPMEREVARIEWADATTYERDHPLVDQIGAALGLTPVQINTMWQGALAL